MLGERCKGTPKGPPKTPAGRAAEIRYGSPANRLHRLERLQFETAFCLFTAGLRAAYASGGQFQPDWKNQKSFSRTLPKLSMFAAVALVSIAVTGAASAQSATEIQLSYKDKKFDPAEISAPANTPIVIKLKNLDAKAMEFESKTLHIEKVVAGSSDATINVRAQKPGRS